MRRVQIDGVEGDRVPRRFTPDHAGRFSRGRWGLARTVVATLLAVIGSLSLIAGVSLQWLQQSVVEREGFAQISQQLAADDSLQEELVTAAVDGASAAVQDQDLGGLPFSGTILNFVDQRVSSAIEDYAQSEDYVDDWNEVVLTTHELNLQPAGTGTAEGAPEDLELYVAPVVDSIEERIEDRIGFGIDLDLRSQDSLGGADGIIVVTDSETGPVFDTIADSTDRTPFLFGGAITALAVAFVLGRHREWALIGAGAGLVAGALYARRAAGDLTDAVTSSPGLEEVGRSVVQRIFELLLTGMDGALLPWLWAGVIAAVAGALLAGARVFWRWGADDGEDEAYPRGRRRRVVEV